MNMRAFHCDVLSRDCHTRLTARTCRCSCHDVLASPVLANFQANSCRCEIGERHFPGKSGRRGECAKECAAGSSTAASRTADER